MQLMLHCLSNNFIIYRLVICIFFLLLSLKIMTLALNATFNWEILSFMQLFHEKFHLSVQNGHLMPALTCLVWILSYGIWKLKFPLPIFIKHHQLHSIMLAVLLIKGEADHCFHQGSLIHLLLLLFLCFTSIELVEYEVLWLGSIKCCI